MPALHILSLTFSNNNLLQTELYQALTDISLLSLLDECGSF